MHTQTVEHSPPTWKAWAFLRRLPFPRVVIISRSPGHRFERSPPPGKEEKWRNFRWFRQRVFGQSPAYPVGFFTLPQEIFGVFGERVCGRTCLTETFVFGCYIGLRAGEFYSSMGGWAGLQLCNAESFCICGLRANSDFNSLLFCRNGI